MESGNQANASPTALPLTAAYLLMEAQNASDGPASDHRSPSDHRSASDPSHLHRRSKSGCNPNPPPKTGEQKAYNCSETRSNLLTPKQETEPWTEVRGQHPKSLPSKSNPKA
jgi:hypothetical protein